MNKNIEKLFALLPDNMSEANKNGVIEFIKEGIADAQRDWEEKMTAKDTALADAKKTIEDLKAKADESSSKVDQLVQEIESLKDEAQARAREAKFQERMAMIKDEFELTEAETERVVKKAKDLDDDEFTEWYEDFSAFAHSKRKSVIEAANNERDEELKSLQERIVELEKSDDKKDKEDKSDKSEASESTETTEGDEARQTEDALDNMQEEANQSVAQAQTPSESEPTWEDQMKAFRDSVEIKI